jgi:hypothetical protein
MRKDDITLVRLRPHEPGSDERCLILRLLWALPGLRAEQIESQLTALVAGGRVAVRDAMDALAQDGRIRLVPALNAIGIACWENVIPEQHQRLQPARRRIV